MATNTQTRARKPTGSGRQTPGALRRLATLQNRVDAGRAATAQRNQLVAQLHETGTPTRRIAEQLGMTVSGVQRIIHAQTRLGG